MRPLLFLAGLLIPTAFGTLAQCPAAGNSSYVLVASPGPGTTPPTASAGKPVATAVFAGQVVGPTGAALPNSVVRLVGTFQLDVTNGEGEFHFTVPATNAPLQLLVSDAGFESETATFSPHDRAATVVLVTSRVIKVARKQQLKTYLKTARRQVKRSLRHL